MQYNRLIFVLPSYGLDDFPEQLEESLAVDLLGAWSSLWHPALLLATNGIPEWKRADSGSLDVENAIVLAPQVALSKVDQPLRERFSLHNCLWVESAGSRSQTLQALESKLKEEAPSPSPDSTQASVEGAALVLDPSPVEFFALGFAFLQIHLLTKKLRYSSNLNQPLFVEQVIEASKAYLAKDEVECERWLQSCFDQLSQERDHYYSQTAYLLDLTLLAPTTLGAKLTKQLLDARPERPVNLFASASILEKLATSQPANEATLKDSIREGKVELVGGVDIDLDTRRMTPQDFRRYLDAGQRAYQKLSYASPRIFAKYNAGFTADFPMHLLAHGYQGAILFDWTSGSYPVGNQGKITWEGADGSGLDTIANYILDASSASSFLAIGSTLGAQFDHHQVPTLMFAHWPGGSCEAFEDFLRVARRTPALGVWSGLQNYFESTQRPYHQERISPTKFPTPDSPSSESERTALRFSVQAESGHSIEQLAIQICHWLGKEDSSKTLQSEPASTDAVSLDRPLQDRLLSEAGADNGRVLLEKGATPMWVNWERAIQNDPIGEKGDPNREVASQLLRNEAINRLKKALPRVSKGEPSTRSWLIANPYGGPRRVYMSLPAALTPNPDHRIYAADTDGGSSDVVIDIPPMGIVRIDANQAATPKTIKRKGGLIANNGNVLGNEFIEAHIDPATGKLSSLYIALKRGNRLSGMLAMRLNKPGSAGIYTSMKADSIQVEKSNTACGKIRIDGQLMAEKKRAAKFTLEYTLWRGSRLVEVDVVVSDIDTSATDGSGYVAWRTAWPNESASLSVWNQGAKQPFGGKKTFSPLIIEVDEVEHRAYLLSGGCSLHRRVNERFLDSVLGEVPCGRLHGRFALGIDLPRPYQSAMEWLDPPIWIEDEPAPLASGNAAWFIQSSLPNVSMVPWSALTETNGKLAGMRAWLHESSGRGGTVRIECFRTPKKAARVEVGGRSLSTIDIDGDSLVFEVRPNEQSYIDILWS